MYFIKNDILTNLVYYVFNQQEYLTNQIDENDKHQLDYNQQIMIEINKLNNQTKRIEERLNNIESSLSRNISYIDYLYLQNNKTQETNQGKKQVTELDSTEFALLTDYYIKATDCSLSVCVARLS